MNTSTKAEIGAILSGRWGRERAVERGGSNLGLSFTGHEQTERKREGGRDATRHKASGRKRSILR